MSRIGRMPVALEGGVKVSIDAGAVSVQGPKGAMTHALPRGISAEIEGEQLLVRRKDDSKKQRALHGLCRALLANAVHGVTQGFKRDLEIHGVGYRAEMKGKAIQLNLGYTHPVDYEPPAGVQLAVEKNTRISVSGHDRQQVGQVAAILRSFRPPDVYKLKGVRYAGESLRKKAGKTGAK